MYSLNSNKQYCQDYLGFESSLACHLYFDLWAEQANEIKTRFGFANQNTSVL